MHWRRKWQPTPVFLPGESQGQELGGLPSMGSHSQLPESTQIHVDRVNDAIQPSHPLLSPSPPALKLFQFGYLDSEAKIIIFVEFL